MFYSMIYDVILMIELTSDFTPYNFHQFRLTGQGTGNQEFADTHILHIVIGIMTKKRQATLNDLLAKCPII